MDILILDLLFGYAMLCYFILCMFLGFCEWDDNGDGNRQVTITDSRRLHSGYHDSVGVYEPFDFVEYFWTKVYDEDENPVYF